jgi:glycogen(starch) synthase
MRQPEEALRVAVILTELSGVTEYTGGIGTRYAAFLPALVSSGLDVTVLLFANSKLLPMMQVPPGVRLIMGKDLLRLPIWARSVPRAIMARRLLEHASFDLILSPEWEGAVALLSRSIPVITNLVTGVDAALDAGPDTALLLWLKTRPQAWLERRQIKKSIAIVACSTAMLEWYRVHLFRLPEMQAVIPNCIDVEKIQEIAASPTVPHDWPASEKIVLFVGRLEPRKGFDIALASSISLAQTHPDVHFVFAGSSPDPRYVRTLINRLMPEGNLLNLHFLGGLKPSDVHSSMALSSVVVAASRWEAFGNVALEAKACGTPLIATLGSGFGDFCTADVDCRLVPPGDADALTAAITGILAKPAEAALLITEGKRTLSQFTPGAVATQWVSWLGEVLG